jgi:hypothetical protein
MGGYFDLTASPRQQNRLVKVSLEYIYTTYLIDLIELPRNQHKSNWLALSDISKVICFFWVPETNRFLGAQKQQQKN